MSIEGSAAASLRTICWRCPSAPFGSLLYTMVYLPPLCALQVSTACWRAPELSGKL